MENEIFYAYESSSYNDGILLNEFRNEYSLVMANRKDGKVFMEWMFPQKKDGSKAPLEKSLPWKIKLGNKTEAINALKFFLSHLEGEAQPSQTASAPPKRPRQDGPPEDLWPESGPSDDDIPF
jgi:hypothetical protein